MGAGGGRVHGGELPEMAIVMGQLSWVPKGGEAGTGDGRGTVEVLKDRSLRWMPQVEGVL